MEEEEAPAVPVGFLGPAGTKPADTRMKRVRMDTHRHLEPTDEKRRANGERRSLHDGSRSWISSIISQILVIVNTYGWPQRFRGGRARRDGVARAAVAPPAQQLPPPAPAASLALTTTKNPPEARVAADQEFARLQWVEYSEFRVIIPTAYNDGRSLGRDIRRTIRLDLAAIAGGCSIVPVPGDGCWAEDGLLMEDPWVRYEVTGATRSDMVRFAARWAAVLGQHVVRVEERPNVRVCNVPPTLHEGGATSLHQESATGQGVH